MFIHKVIVNGFKSYDQTITFGPFTPGRNAIIGLNGSGKSNFYSAIGFVLLDEYTHLRVSDKKALIHDGHTRSGKFASVEIIFDNAKRQIPIDTDYVSIKRSIGIKKDEYQINNKISTLKEVHNLLESCGFSPSNGYYIVRQGKINGLTLMKDSNRLDLLMEIAGTKYYDKQRENALKMLNESNERINKIQESFEYIIERITQLEVEKEELEEYERIEKYKKAIDYLISNKEMETTENELNMKDIERNNKKEEIEQKLYEYENIHQQIKSQQNEMKVLIEEEKELNNEKGKIEEQNNEMKCNQKMTEFKIQEIQLKIKSEKRIQNTLNNKLSRIDSSITNCENELEQIQEEYNKISDQKALIEGKIEGLQQIVGGCTQSPKEVEDELVNTQHKIEMIEKEKEQIQIEVDTKLNELGYLNEEQNQNESKLNELYNQRNLIDERNNFITNHIKELWKKEDKHLNELTKIDKNKNI